MAVDRSKMEIVNQTPTANEKPLVEGAPMKRRRRFHYECVTCPTVETHTIEVEPHHPHKDDCTIRLVRCPVCTANQVPLPALEKVS